ncbi:MAG: Glycosyl transferase family 39 [Candidatus Daviesbacteria bacterium GW2011_GWA1_42_6]|uniref:Glycosyl transferase family 39 n=1 Tax=Candidatus Daviesbacteria bacterium GW2011_GWA1_42_6 TaxID=1618420 RepID=A0A0G1DN71_9BACT|nr:MAG: Glycosyl transferase family 39 [Candidatus Daviesbacteria bacterium GW2011_GWA1_42_6]
MYKFLSSKSALALVSALVFFIAVFLTLSDYGISWDETIHFRRGQAYLNYFLTRQLNYEKLPILNLQGTNGDPSKVIYRRSLYQNDFHNGEYFLKNDSGHPPLNGILSALSNYIFFQELGIIGDVEAHHLFNIFAASILVFVVVSLAVEYFGIFAAVISFLALFTYPLFFAESHFNVKDPPEAAFIAATIWAFLKYLRKGSLGWIIIAFIFFALGLGTKFNILFLPLIIFPYLFLRYGQKSKNFLDVTEINFKKLALIFPLGFVIIGIIFVGSWPYLWQNPENILNIFEYYKGIGTGLSYQPENFFIFGFNTFPLLWILFTTPPLTLIFLIFGLLAVFLSKNDKKSFGFLLILWLAIPILRVILPGSTIYGGIRQVMEFLPAMALLSGFGAWQIIQWSKKGKAIALILQVVLILLFLWPASVLINLHPNENVYFNSFIGGLSGAKEVNFPSWGNSFGNAYYQGIKWINANSDKDAKVVLLQGTLANAPLIYFRPDIKYLPESASGKKNYFSGINREGEYIMELTFNDSGKDFFYRWEYVEKFLNPVYELKVDGVSILKIWQNDLNNTKEGMRLAPVVFKNPVKTVVDNQFLYIDPERKLNISNLEIEFDQRESCSGLKTAFMETSVDRINWNIEKDAVPQNQIFGNPNLENKKVSYHFAGRPAKYIRVATDSKNSCLFNNPKVTITSLESD